MVSGSQDWGHCALKALLTVPGRDSVSILLILVGRYAMGELRKRHHWSHDNDIHLLFHCSDFTPNEYWHWSGRHSEFWSVICDVDALRLMPFQFTNCVNETTCLLSHNTSLLYILMHTLNISCYLCICRCPGSMNVFSCILLLKSCALKPDLVGYEWLAVDLLDWAASHHLRLLILIVLWVCRGWESVWYSQIYFCHGTRIYLVCIW